MKNEIVIVRALGNKPLIRKVWGTDKNVVYVINENKPEITPIGVPKEDVFIYMSTIDINSETEIDWERLNHWYRDQD